MMNLFLVRHGQSTNNALPHGDPHIPDPSLTELGREQARFTGTALQAAVLGAVALYASPMRRALETARILQSALQLPLYLFVDLCESGGLRAERGLCRAEILRDYPGAILEDRIGENGWWNPNPDSEPEESVYARVDRSIALLTAQHGAKQETALVITHGTYGSAFISRLFGMEPGGYTRFEFNNCGVTHLEIRHSLPLSEGISSEGAKTEAAGAVQIGIGKTRVVYHNSTAHLPAAFRT